MKRPISAKTLITAALSVSIIGAIVVGALGGAQGVRGTVQLGVFPFLLLILSALTLRGTRIPRVLVGVSAIGVLCGAIVRYSDVGLKPGAFGIARFKGDSLETTTRILRDRARVFLGEGALTKLGVLGITVRSEGEARDALKEHPQLAGILWGSERWINISSAPVAPLSLASLPENSFARQRMRALGVKDLQIMTYVPWIGVAQALDAATAEFVGSFLRISRDFPNALRGVSTAGDIELQLRGAAWIRARWTTSEHIGAIKWMLGTLHLMRAISGPELDWGEFKCAEASFDGTRLIAVKTGGNLALNAAIFNNESVLRILTAEYTAQPDKELKEAEVKLHRAYTLKKRAPVAPYVPGYWEPIIRNMKGIGVVTADVEESLE